MKGNYNTKFLEAIDFAFKKCHFTFVPKAEQLQVCLLHGGFFKEARNSFSFFQTNKHILSLDTVRAIISRRNLARVLSTYRRFRTLCFPPK